MAPPSLGRRAYSGRAWQRARGSALGDAVGSKRSFFEKEDQKTFVSWFVGSGAWDDAASVLTLSPARARRAVTRANLAYRQELAKRLMLLNTSSARCNDDPWASMSQLSRSTSSLAVFHPCLQPPLLFSKKKLFLMQRRVHLEPSLRHRLKRLHGHAGRHVHQHQARPAHVEHGEFGDDEVHDAGTG